MLTDEGSAPLPAARQQPHLVYLVAGSIPVAPTSTNASLEPLCAHSEDCQQTTGTQQADDSRLAVRDAEVTRQPLRIVLDSNARTPASARVLDDAAPTLIAVAEDADAAHLEGRADVVRLPRWMTAWT